MPRQETTNACGADECGIDAPPHTAFICTPETARRILEAWSTADSKPRAYLEYGPTMPAPTAIALRIPLWSEPQ
jgi:hypothetical protein